MSERQPHGQRPGSIAADLPPTALTVIAAMEDKKAFGVTVLDLRGTGAFTDMFVVCSGHTTRQVKAIADAISERLKADGTRPTHIEGYDHAQWILMDCFDLVVHIFTDETRLQYDLERLWGSARIVWPARPQAARPGLS